MEMHDLPLPVMPHPYLGELRFHRRSLWHITLTSIPRTTADHDHIPVGPHSHPLRVANQTRREPPALFDATLYPDDLLLLRLCDAITHHNEVAGFHSFERRGVTAKICVIPLAT